MYEMLVQFILEQFYYIFSQIETMVYYDFIYFCLYTKYEKYIKPRVEGLLKKVSFFTLTSKCPFGPL